MHCFFLPGFVRAGCYTGADPLGQLIQTIHAEVKAEEAMNFMRQAYSTDRWFTFSKFHETAEYLKQSMKGIGLEEVELSGAPADGSSQSGFWTMPLAWA